MIQLNTRNKEINMRITKQMIDDIYTLKQKAEAASAAYEAAVAKLRDAGPNVYKGNCAALCVEEATRRTVDNKAIFAAFQVPADMIERHTKVTTYCRATFKEMN
jgi:hypothetical protein